MEGNENLSPGPIVFTFRIEAREVEDYRRALGVEGMRVPLGMALRALASDAVLPPLRKLAGACHIVHAGQDYRVEQPLAVNVDYCCEVRLTENGPGRIRIEQRLNHASGTLCAILASDIVLVPA